VSEIVSNQDGLNVRNFSTYPTSSPASLIAFAVPPEAISLNPRLARSLAKSSNPVLSDTLSNAGK